MYRTYKTSMVFRTVSRMQQTAHLTSQNVWSRTPTDVYQPGHRLSLLLSNSKSAEVEIVKAFTPFTSSATLLVDAQSSSTHTGLPNRFILKLADRRVDLEWNLEEEKVYESNLRSYMSKNGAASELWHDDPRMPLFEAWQSSNTLYLREREAYERLTEAQASGLIPRFFGTAKIEMIPTAPHPSLRHIDGLLLEYIPGRSMASIRPGFTITFDEAEIISQRVIELGRRLRRYGVRHCDIHGGNVILRVHDNSPVLIDWGLASFVVADLPLRERWQDHHCWMDYHKDIRLVLSSGMYYEGPDQEEVYPPFTAGGVWHRFRTPLSDRALAKIAQENSYLRANAQVYSLSQEEIEQFYDEDTSVDMNHAIRWKVKEGVRTREQDDPCPEEY